MSVTCAGGDPKEVDPGVPKLEQNAIRTLCDHYPKWKTRGQPASFMGMGAPTTPGDSLPVSVNGAGVNGRKLTALVIAKPVASSDSHWKADNYPRLLSAPECQHAFAILIGKCRSTPTLNAVFDTDFCAGGPIGGMIVWATYDQAGCLLLTLTLDQGPSNNPVPPGQAPTPGPAPKPLPPPAPPAPPALALAPESPAPMLTHICNTSGVKIDDASYEKAKDQMCATDVV